jgi:hypothetical protein
MKGNDEEEMVVTARRFSYVDIKLIETKAGSYIVRTENETQGTINRYFPHDEWDEANEYYDELVDEAAKIETEYPPTPKLAKTHRAMKMQLHGVDLDVSYDTDYGGEAMILGVYVKGIDVWELLSEDTQAYILAEVEG